MKTCDYRQEENVIELILKAKDIRVEFKGRTCLDIDEYCAKKFPTITFKFRQCKVYVNFHFFAKKKNSDVKSKFYFSF